MADRTPIETKNLDIYGKARLQWGRPQSKPMMRCAARWIDRRF
jgi:hypothetical protein